MLRRTIGVSAALLGSDTTIHPIPGYELTALQGGDLANISAIILDQDDIDAGKVAEINEYGFGIPVFAAVKSTKDTTNLEGLHGVIALDELQGDYFARQIAAAADKFEDEVLPPFFGALTKYYNRGFSPFDCPGHQGGQFFRQHPAGRRFFDFYGEELFRTDLCNADVAMGDLLIHDG
ncbi:MAG: Orn/Lys/Arg decarboxylase N-terminal domain-containing protein, partial [Dermabacter sp.]|nr:Orn/Lys/Arg decarboxylase N-terminal domain-containing protein [Dermabacter sp.]